MFKRIGALAMILAGGLAVLTPAVAQARDRDDYRYERHDRREWRDDRYRDRDRDWRAHEWREHERAERRYYYDRFGRPFYYDQFGRICR